MINKFDLLSTGNSIGNNNIEKSTDYRVKQDFFFSSSTGSASITADEILSTPYLSHYLVFAVCRNISMNIANLDFKIYDKKNATYVEDRLLTPLLANPNWMMDSTSFKETIVLGLLLPTSAKAKGTGGQVFLLGTDKKGNYVDFRKGIVPADIEVLFSELPGKYSIKGIIDDKSGMFKHWLYDFNNRKKELLNSEVIRIRFTNPYNQLLGASWFYPVYQQVLQDILSDIYNSEFYKNDCSISGILKPKQVLTQQQIDTLYYSWMQKYSSAGNNRKLAILSADAEYQQIGVSPKDMQFVEQKKNSIDAVLASFGMNKIGVGRYEDVNYATIVEGRRMLWQDTYLPIANRIVAALNDQWIKYYDSNLEIKIDTSEIDALRPDYTPVIGTYTALVNSGFPPALACKKTGITITEEELKQYPWLNENPFNKFNFNTEESKPEPEEPEEPEEDGLDEEKKRLKRSKIIKKMGELDKLTFAKSHVKKYVMPNEKKAEKKILDFLKWQGKEIESVILDSIKNKSITKEIDFDDDALDSLRKESNAKLKTVVSGILSDVAKSQTQALASETDGAIRWYADNKFFSKYLKERMKYIDDINTTTFDSVIDKVQKIIQDGIDSKLTTDEIADKIKENVGDIITARGGSASTIARTETNSASSMCRVDAFEKDGIEYVEWSAFVDDVTRDTHKVANGAGAVKLGDNFPGVNMRWPLDENGEVEDIVNCRCVLIASEKNLQ